MSCVQLYDRADQADVLAAIHEIERQGIAMTGVRFIVSSGNAYQIGWCHDGLIGEIITANAASQPFQIIHPKFQVRLAEPITLASEPFRFPNPDALPAFCSSTWIEAEVPIPEGLSLRPGLLARLWQAVTA